MKTFDQEILYKVYFVIFRHLYEFLLIFNVWNPFWYLKQLEKESNQRNSAWTQSGPRAQTVGSAHNQKQPTRPIPSAQRVGTPWPVTPHRALMVARPRARSPVAPGRRCQRGEHLRGEGKSLGKAT
jgi:hypothetical protein